MAPISLPVCAAPGCGEQLPPPARTGRPRRYCSDLCRDRARRSRRSGWATDDVLSDPPSDPLTRRQRTFEAVAQLFDGAPAAPSEDQLRQALLELTQLAFALRRLAADLHPNLGARASRLADLLDEAVHSTFGAAA